MSAIPAWRSTTGGPEPSSTTNRRPPGTTTWRWLMSAPPWVSPAGPEIDGIRSVEGIPDMPRRADGLARPGGIGDQQGEVVVLRGVRQRADIRSTLEPVGHRHQAGGDRDLVVEQPGRRECVAVDPGLAEGDSAQVLAIQVAVLPGVVTGEREVRR